jgi:hypothetical protein
MGRSTLSKGKKNILSTGPSGPPAGLLAEIDSANADRLAADVPALLAAARAGRPDAARELAMALRWIVYDSAGDTANFEAVLTPYFLALDTCVQRLANNDVPPENVEKFVRDELSRTRRRAYRSDSDDLHVPYSTAWDYEKREKAITGLRRCRQDNVDMDLAAPVVEDPNTPQPLLDQRGRHYERPSRMIQPSVVDLAVANELRRMVARSRLERQVLAGLRRGRSIRRIAKALGTTKYRVEQVIRFMRSRAIGLGFEPPEQRRRRAA